MSITIEDHNQQIQKLALAAGFISAEQYLMELVDQDAERQAILEGLKDFEEGRTIPADEVYARIRKELNLPVTEV